MAINKVSPSFIRIEADEVTYILHIIVRFEIERDMIEGSLDVNDAPRVWNKKMKEYLGVTPPDHKMGILQDVHWACGYFGYFPSYALGCIMASQLFASALKDMPDLNNRISKGDTSGLLAWLRKKIHRHGRIYKPNKLVKRVTGSELRVEPYMAYLKNKFGAIYDL